MRRRESDRLNPRDFKWFDGSLSFCTSLAGKAWLDLHPQSDRVISAVELTRFGSVIDYAMSLAAAEKWSYAV